MKNKSVFILKGILSMCLAIIVLWHLKQLNGIHIINDEFGYWGIAAQASGKDWSALLEQTPYYSYGYSMLLIPLFLMHLSPETMYHIAIIINAFLLIWSFWIAVSCGRLLFPNIKPINLVISCFLITLYSNNIIQSQIAWTETLLYFLYWLLVWGILQILFKRKMWNFPFIAVISVYMYGVHQRTIGIILALIIFMVVFIKIELPNKRQIIFFISTMFICFIVHSFIKQILNNQIFTDIYLGNINTLQSQTSKLETIWRTKEGIIELLNSIIGKLYYLGTATFLLAFIGIWCYTTASFDIIKKIVNTKLRKWNSKQAIYLFLFLSSAATFMVGAIAMNDASDRLDTLIYGRYMEFAIGPLLLCAICYFLENKIVYKQFIIASSILFCFAFIVNNTWIKYNPQVFNNYCATTLTYFFVNKKQVPYLAFYISLLTTLLGFVALLVRKSSLSVRKRDLSIVSCCLILGMGWIYLAGQTPVWEAQKDKIERIMPMVNFLNKLEYNENLYFLFEDDEGINMKAKYYQYFMPESKFTPIFKNDLEGDKLNDVPLLAASNSKSITELLQTYTKVYEVGGITAYAKNEGTVIKQAQLLAAGEQHIIEILEKSIIKKGQIANHLAEKKLYRGTYKVQFSIEFLENNSAGGYCRITADNGNTIIQEVEFKNESGTKEKKDISLSFSLPEAKAVSFDITLTDGECIKITELSYQQNLWQYTIGLDNAKDAMELPEVLKNYSLPVSVLVDENTDISIEYLKSILPEYDVTTYLKEDLLKHNIDNYVLADKNNFDWMALLGKYDILQDFANYYLLISHDYAVRKDLHISLSEGIYANISLMLKKDNAYYVNEIEDLPSGKYQVMLLMTEPNLRSTTEEKILSVYSEDKLLNEMKIELSQKQIEVPFESTSEIKDLTIQVKSEYGEDVPVRVKGLAMLLDSDTYYFNKMFQPLLDTYLNTASLHESMGIFDPDYQYYNLDKFKHFLDELNITNYEWIDSSKAIEQQKLSSLKYLIVPSNSQYMYAMLPTFQIINTTEKYTLLTQKNITSEQRFSQDTTVSSDYFRLITNPKEVKSLISIPKGIYNLQVELTGLTELPDLPNLGQLMVYSNHNLISEVSMTKNHISFDNGHYIFSVPVSGINGLEDIDISILSRDDHIIDGRIKAIQYISDGYLINFKDMFMNGGESVSSPLSTHGSEPVTVYGPYMHLTSGKYRVRFQYTSDNPSSIRFDVAANAGNIIADMTNISYTIQNDKYQVELVFESINDMNDVEFRAFIPANVECELEQISLYFEEL
ncbi:hypothetical protein [Hungatella effluvii]|uniref:hypothetical protein n=1 Tax=Hungatella effluvii TaxID=1096246 RepID=UPI0022E02926|nr:hypothetical protein [Hungatella effluvii]